jgi:hypothetical protein
MDIIPLVYDQNATVSGNVSRIPNAAENSRSSLILKHSVHWSTNEQ